MQTALYGVELWGLFELRHMDALANPLQQLMAKFLRLTLQLPNHTSTVILMLESGQKPAFTYCIRRTTGFIHKCHTSHDALLHAMVEDRQFMAPWNAFITSIANCEARAHNKPTTRMPTSRSSQDMPVTPANPAEVLLMLEPMYAEALLKYTADTPHAATAHHRTTSTYVQEIWNKRIASTHHTRHVFYDAPAITYQQYRAWLRVRTLTLQLPAYVPTTPDTPPHSNCPLACPSRGDLRHWAMHCEHVQLELRAALPMTYTPPTSMWALFNQFSDIHALASHIHMLFKLLNTAA